MNQVSIGKYAARDHGNCIIIAELKIVTLHFPANIFPNLIMRLDSQPVSSLELKFVGLYANIDIAYVIELLCV